NPEGVQILLTEHATKRAHPACPEPRREEPPSATKDLLLLPRPTKGPRPEELKLTTRLARELLGGGLQLPRYRRTLCHPHIYSVVLCSAHLIPSWSAP